MLILRRIKGPVQISTVGLIVLALLVLGMASCRTAHRPERRAQTNLDPGWPRGDNFFYEVSCKKLPAVVPEVAGAEYVNDDELCMGCHKTYAETFAHNVHNGDSCESCHGPASRHLETRGKEPGLILSFKTLSAAQKSEICLKCHEDNQCSPGAQFRYSKHAHCGVSCTDCHTAHYNVPAGTPPIDEPGVSGIPLSNSVHLAQYQKPAERPSLSGTSNNLGAATPGICFRCHSDYEVFTKIAGPHQICGPNGFDCTTCHDPHGNIRERSRKEMCLECHNENTPTMAYHSSLHDRKGVACTDCHNPHPVTCVPQVVGISHTQVKRPQRLPMSVSEPEVCYKCHPEIFGRSAMPSHHPIKEGKMVCSDCHDPHGQSRGNLKEASVNEVCYKCHAEKLGPFVWEHPPVRQDCLICHEPHGTVANNLLRQPATFLCLRCHAGHRKDNRNPDMYGTVRAATYTNCTQCHAQIHGSDLPSNTRRRTYLR